MNKSSKLNFIINVLFYGTVAVIIYLIIKFLFVYMLPFIIGTIVTVAVQKPADKLSCKINIRKGYCALILVVLIYLVIVTLAGFILFELGAYVYNIATGDSLLTINIKNFADSLIESIDNITLKIPQFIIQQLSVLGKNVMDGLIEFVSNFAKSLVKAMPMFFTSFVVTIIASCYIAKDYDRFKESILSVTSAKYKKAFATLKGIFNENVTKVLIGYFKILLITFSELAIGLFLLRVENFILYAALISLLDLLPIFGTGTVLIPWGLYSIITSNYFLGAGLVILYIIISIIRSVLEPKIIGKQIGLHPLIALIAVFIGLKLFGFVGLFLLPFSIVFIYKSFDKGVFDILFGNKN